MIYRELAGTGRKASVIAMGSTYFGTSTPEALSREILDAYAELGGNFLDTARVYGDFAKKIGGIAEGVIGRWMRDRGNREKIVLATKGGHPDLDTMRVGRLDRKSLETDLALSLEALDTPYADLYWLHRDDESRSVADILETLNGFVADKRIRAFGASNWSPRRIREANRYAAEHGLRGFSADEPQWSLARQEVSDDPTLWQMEGELYRMHLETGMPCVPFSSQAKGFFIKLFEGGEEALSEKARHRFLSAHNLSIYGELIKIREKCGLSVGAISLSYLTGQPFPVFPIVGVSRLEQVVALREAGDAVLEAADVKKLNDLAFG